MHSYLGVDIAPTIRIILGCLYLARIQIQLLYQFTTSSFVFIGFLMRIYKSKCFPLYITQLPSLNTYYPIDKSLAFKSKTPFIHYLSTSVQKFTYTLLIFLRFSYYFFSCLLLYSDYISQLGVSLPFSFSLTFEGLSCFSKHKQSALCTLSSNFRLISIQNAFPKGFPFISKTLNFYNCIISSGKSYKKLFCKLIVFKRNSSQILGQMVVILLSERSSYQRVLIVNTSLGIKDSSLLLSDSYFLLERLACRNQTDSSVIQFIILLKYYRSFIIMQKESQQWEHQHLYRYFTTKYVGTQGQLCKALGWKIFTIDQSDSAMHFSNGYIANECLQQFLEGVNSTNIRNVYLNGNHLRSTLRLISDIVFSNLIVLQLSSNNIGSIQSIAKINTSHLKILLLSDNCITSIKPLVKCDLTSVQTLCLDKNYISQIVYFLSRMNIRNLIRLQANSNLCRSEGLSIIVKNPSQMLQSIHQSYSKIVFPRTKQTFNVILQKYPRFQKYIFC